MKRISTRILVIGMLVLSVTVPVRTIAVGQQAIDAQRALGKWYSVERFENEPRISVSFSRTERSIAGWAVLLGQHRKDDDRATLGLSFSEATWTGQALHFSTILPEDEGTIGWELRVTYGLSLERSQLTSEGRLKTPNCRSPAHPGKRPLSAWPC